MNNLSKLFIILLFLSFSQNGWTISCFSDSAPGSLDDSAVLSCINQALEAEPMTGHSSRFLDVSTAISSLKGYDSTDDGLNNTNPETVMATISGDSSRVFYNDDHCGHSANPPTYCEQMRELAILHSGGSYTATYDCSSRAPDHPTCRHYVGAIVNWIESHDAHVGTGIDCDGSNENKLFCNDVITPFLATAPCNGRPGASESACQTFVENRFRNAAKQNCVHSFWQNSRGSNPSSPIDMVNCSGPSAPDVSPAAVPVAETPSPDDASDVTGGDNSAPEETPTTEDEEDLIAAMDQAAADTFGGMPGDFSQASLDATTQIPGVDPSGPSGGSISGSSMETRGPGYSPGSSTAIPGISRLSPPTRGKPGGSPKNIGGGGAPGGGAPGGGGVAGAGGVNQDNNPRGGASKGRRGGGASFYSGLAKNMNSGYIGTDSAGGTSGGGAATIKESPVDKKIKKAIAENNKNKLNKEALQKALNRNLNTPGGRQELVLRSSYFPGHSEVYLWLHQRSDLLDERGL